MEKITIEEDNQSAHKEAVHASPTTPTDALFSPTAIEKSTILNIPRHEVYIQ